VGGIEEEEQPTAVPTVAPTAAPTPTIEVQVGPLPIELPNTGMAAEKPAAGPVILLGGLLSALGLWARRRR